MTEAILVSPASVRNTEKNLKIYAVRRSKIIDLCFCLFNAAGPVSLHIWLCSLRSGARFALGLNLISFFNYIELILYYMYYYT